MTGRFPEHKSRVRVTTFSGGPECPPGEAVHKPQKVLPKAAAVCHQWVRCGRACATCAEKPGHGPYAYLFWREQGRLYKAYVPPDEVMAMRKLLEDRRAERRSFASKLRRARGQLATARTLLFEVEHQWTT